MACVSGLAAMATISRKTFAIASGRRRRAETGRIVVSPQPLAQVAETQQLSDRSAARWALGAGRWALGAVSSQARSNPARLVPPGFFDEGPPLDRDL